jgi:hypothetical protein
MKALLVVITLAVIGILFSGCYPFWYEGRGGGGYHHHHRY